MRRSRISRSPAKQGQAPLKRRKPLDPGQKPLERGTPLKPGKPLARRSIQTKGKAARARQSRPAALNAAERRASESWHRRTLARCERRREGGSVLLVCPACGKLHRAGEIQAHHVIGQEQIRRYVNGLRLPLDAALKLLVSLLWDRRNGFPACVRCHDRHTKAVERLPRALLDRKHEQFAREIGLDYLLDRDYT